MMNPRTFWLIFGFATLVSTAPARADGTEALGEPGIAIAAGTGVVAGGTGMHDPLGIITVAVPTGATVKQVILYWEGFMAEEVPGDDTLSVVKLPALPVAVTGELIGGPTFFYGSYNGNPAAYASTYRADITHLGLVTAGLNTLLLSEMEFTHVNNGAGVIVIFDDGTSEAQIQIRDGSDLAYLGFAEPLQNTVAQTFNFPAATTARSAQLNLFFASVSGTVSTGDLRPTAIEITSGGITTVLVNALDSVSGQEWDAITISAEIPAGATSLTVQPFSRDDLGTGGRPASFDWLAAAFTLESEVSCRRVGRIRPNCDEDSRPERKSRERVTCEPKGPGNLLKGNHQTHKDKDSKPKRR